MEPRPLLLAIQPHDLAALLNFLNVAIPMVSAKLVRERELGLCDVFHVMEQFDQLGDRLTEHLGDDEWIVEAN